MSLYYDYEIDEYEKITDEIKSIISDKHIIKVDINDLKINDMVYVCFYPDSQKYIYMLTPKIGKVSSIENEDDPCIKIINYKNETEYLLHPGVSYMGHSLGYDYQIYLIE